MGKAKILAFLFIFVFSFFTVIFASDWAIIYGSRYGSTKLTSEWIVEGMDLPVDIIDAKEALNRDLSNYKYIVLGSGIYYGDIQEDLNAFLEKRKDEIAPRVVAVFVVCGASGPYTERYIEVLKEKSGASPKLGNAFPGRMIKKSLSKEDYEALEGFSTRRGRPFEDYDRMDKSLCLDFGKKLVEVVSEN
jgi:flavodoxin